MVHVLCILNNEYHTSLICYADAVHTVHAQFAFSFQVALDLHLEESVTNCSPSKPFSIIFY